MILQEIFPRDRIIAAIVVEFVVMVLTGIITGIIIFRYQRSKKSQLRSMVYFFICYLIAIAGSIVGKTLTAIASSFDLDKTELGFFTNWSFSLGLIVYGVYWQLEVSWELFPPKIKQYRLLTQLVTISMILFILTIPRYGFGGIELKLLFNMKFVLLFVYLLGASLYYMINSYKIYTFILNKFLQNRILSGLIFYSCLILMFIFFMISSIYGSITSIYYTWGYFFAIAFMLGASIAAFFSVKQGKESDRQDIDEELRKLRQDRKKRPKNSIIKVSPDTQEEKQK